MQTNKTSKRKVKSTDDILHILCDSVQKVLSITTNTEITYSPMIQRITRTCLKPDIGCFVLFDGGISGLVVLNFSAEAAMEIYQNYMKSMGMPIEEIVTQHTSDEVADTLGELMNQMVGDFQVSLKNEFQVSVNQNRPRMIVINKELMISINAKIDRAQCRKVAFATANHRPFYLEISMEKTEFIELFPFQKEEAVDTDSVFKEAKTKAAGSASDNIKIDAENRNPDSNVADSDFMKDLGL